MKVQKLPSRPTKTKQQPLQARFSPIPLLPTHNNPYFLTITISLEGTPHPSYPLQLKITPSSAQASWSILLFKAASLLKIEDVEGIYTEIGLEPVYRIKSLKEGMRYSVRVTEDCALCRSIVDVGGVERYPNWGIVEEGRRAKVRLKLLVKEFEGLTPLDGVDGSVDAKIDTAVVDLGVISLPPSHESTWRKRLVKRGERRERLINEGLKPDPFDEGSSSEDEDADDSGDDKDGDKDDEIPVIQEKPKYKRNQINVDDPEWYNQYGTAGSLLSHDVTKTSPAAAAVLNDNETGDVLSAFRNDAGLSVGVNLDKSACSLSGRGDVCCIKEDGGMLEILEVWRRCISDAKMAKLSSSSIPSLPSLAKAPPGKTIGPGGNYDIHNSTAGLASVSIYVLRLLSAQLNNSTTNANEFVSVSGHDTVLDVMCDDENERIVDVQKYGALVLANLCNVDNSKVLTGSRFVQVIGNNLKLHIDSTYVLTPCIMSLFKLLRNGDKATAEAVLKSGLNVMQRVGQIVIVHPNDRDVCMFVTWMVHELIKLDFASPVRQRGGVFIISLISTRHYDYDLLHDEALIVEEKMMKGVESLSSCEVNGEAWKRWREREMGRGIGGGVMDDGKVFGVVRKHEEGFLRTVEDAEE